MTKLEMMLLSCLQLLAIISLDLQISSQAEAEENQCAVVQYDEGLCTLPDQKQLFDRPDQGLRLWFGQQLTLKCSIHTYSSSRYPGLKWIDAGGTVVNENGEKPRYYAHHLAFFDADDNLIACGGDVLLDKRVGREPEIRSQDFPIPTGGESAIAKYKSVFYESDHAIGIQATEPLAPTDAPRDKRDLGRTLKINPAHRPLFDKPLPGVHTYTADGTCRVKTQSEKGTELPFVLIGDASHSQAKLYFRTDSSKEVSVWYSLTNYTDISTHHDLYVAFFDDNGHLIASTWLRECHTRPKETTPSVKVIESKGIEFTNLSALSEFSSQLPFDEYKKICNYKATMYVYDKAKRTPE